MDNIDVLKMAEEAKKDINYTLISYRNPVIDTWTIPQPIAGVGEAAEREFIIQTKRACLLGQVKAENIGMEAYVMGTFADGTGKIEVLSQPRLLVVLTIPSSTEALNKA